LNYVKTITLIVDIPQETKKSLGIYPWTWQH